MPLNTSQTSTMEKYHSSFSSSHAVRIRWFSKSLILSFISIVCVLPAHVLLSFYYKPNPFYRSCIPNTANLTSTHNADFVAVFIHICSTVTVVGNSILSPIKVLDPDCSRLTISRSIAKAISPSLDSKQTLILK